MIQLASAVGQRHSHQLVATVTAGSDSGASYWAGLSFVLILVLVGALAYSGRWRSWSTWRVLSRCRVVPLTAGWAGLAMLVIAGGNSLPEPFAQIVALPSSVFLFLCIPGVKWLPRFMLPRWYLIQKDFVRDARRGGGCRTRRTGNSQLSFAPWVIVGRVGVPPVGGAMRASFGAMIGGRVGGVECGQSVPDDDDAGNATAESADGADLG